MVSSIPSRTQTPSELIECSVQEKTKNFNRSIKYTTGTDNYRNRNGNKSSTTTSLVVKYTESSIFFRKHMVQKVGET